MLKLSFQERVVYGLIVEHNLKAEEIAEKLCITVSTAKAHINHILFKRGERSCRDMIFKYYKELLNANKQNYKSIGKTFGEERNNYFENQGSCTKVVRFD